MKTLKLTVLLIVAAFFAANAQVEKEEDSNAPEISFDKTVHDYGIIYKNGDGNCEFTFTNTGKEPLVLTNVKSSCGCTVPKWPRQPILPGKSDVIKVKYATTRIGRINKSITVTSNAKTSTVTLRIKGEVKPQPATTMPEKNIDEESSPVAK